MSGCGRKHRAKHLVSQFLDDAAWSGIDEIKDQVCVCIGPPSGKHVHVLLVKSLPMTLPQTSSDNEMNTFFETQAVNEDMNKEIVFVNTIAADPAKVAILSSGVEERIVDLPGKFRKVLWLAGGDIIICRLGTVYYKPSLNQLKSYFNVENNAFRWKGPIEVAQKLAHDKYSQKRKHEIMRANENQMLSGDAKYGAKINAVKLLSDEVKNDTHSVKNVEEGNQAPALEEVRSVGGEHDRGEKEGLSHEISLEIKKKEYTEVYEREDEEEDDFTDLVNPNRDNIRHTGRQYYGFCKDDDEEEEESENNNIPSLLLSHTESLMLSENKSRSNKACSVDEDGANSLQVACPSVDRCNECDIYSVKTDLNISHPSSPKLKDIQDTLEPVNSVVSNGSIDSENISPVIVGDSNQNALIDPIWKSLRSMTSSLPLNIRKWCRATWMENCAFPDLPAHLKVSTKEETGNTASKPLLKNGYPGLLRERKLVNRVMGILSRVTPDNFDFICNELLQLPIRQSEESEINEVIALFFNKASSPGDTIYAAQYAQLVRKLHDHIASIEKDKNIAADDMVARKIRNRLVTNCTERFEKLPELQRVIEEERKFHEEKEKLRAEGATEDDLMAEQERISVDRKIVVDRLKANIKFLGYLFFSGLVYEKNIVRVLFRLLFGPEVKQTNRLVQDYELDQFSELLMLTAKKIEFTPKNKEYFKELREALQTLSTTHPVLRVKIIALNLVDFIDNDFETGRKRIPDQRAADGAARNSRHQGNAAHGNYGRGATLPTYGLPGATFSNFMTPEETIRKLLKLYSASNGQLPDSIDDLLASSFIHSFKQLDGEKWVELYTNEVRRSLATPALEAERKIMGKFLQWVCASRFLSEDIVRDRVMGSLVEDYCKTLGPFDAGSKRGAVSEAENSRIKYFLESYVDMVCCGGIFDQSYLKILFEALVENDYKCYIIRSEENACENKVISGDNEKQSRRVGKEEDGNNEDNNHDQNGVLINASADAASREEVGSTNRILKYIEHVSALCSLESPSFANISNVLITPFYNRFRVLPVMIMNVTVSGIESIPNGGDIFERLAHKLPFPEVGFYVDLMSSVKVQYDMTSTHITVEPEVEELSNIKQQGKNAVQKMHSNNLQVPLFSVNLNLKSLMEFQQILCAVFCFARFDTDVMDYLMKELQNVFAWHAERGHGLWVLLELYQTWRDCRSVPGDALATTFKLLEKNSARCGITRELIDALVDYVEEHERINFSYVYRLMGH